MGDQALSSSTGTGSDNTAIGNNALLNNTSGPKSVAVGGDALLNNTDGGKNVAVGFQAMVGNTSGSFNTAVGEEALLSNGGGNSNDAFGHSALSSNTNGGNNTALGNGALANNTTGGTNTAVGGSALESNDIGTGNIALGFGAGKTPANPVNSIFIGNQGLAGDSLTIKIGTQGTQTTTTIAGIHTATSASGIAVLVNSNGRLGTTTSSRRYKDDIEPMGDMSAALQKLRPVTFRYKQPDDDGTKPIQYGLIAEEVAEVLPDLAYYANGQLESVKYTGCRTSCSPAISSSRR